MKKTIQAGIAQQLKKIDSKMSLEEFYINYVYNGVDDLEILKERKNNPYMHPYKAFDNSIFLDEAKRVLQLMKDSRNWNEFEKSYKASTSKEGFDLGGKLKDIFENE